MNRNKVRTTFLVMVVILLAGLAVAGVEFEGENLIKTYSGGDVISGTVNLTLSDVPVNAEVSSNFEGQISIKELLELSGYSEGNGFSCSRNGCGERFTEGEIVSSFSLNADNNLVGISVQGQPFQEMEDLSFSVDSNKGSSCSAPFKVDILGNGRDLISSGGYLDTQCFSTKYGCFENYLDSSAYQETQIPVSPNRFCERVTLPEGPAYKIGAKVINSTSGKSVLNMSLLDEEGYLLGSCTLPEHQTSTEELECIVEFSSASTRNYYACISAETSSNYMIRVEFVEPCGTNNPGSSSYSIDYEIFAKNLMYDGSGISISPESFNDLTNEDLLDVVENYVQNNYENSCDPNCIVPIKFVGPSQTLTFDDVSISYSASGANGLENDNLYEISVEPSTLSSGEIEINVDEAGFTIPLGSDEEEFEMYIDNDKVFDVGINLSGGFSFDVNPKFISFGKEATLRVETSRNVSSVRWVFGDGNTKTTNSKSVTHRYTEQGEFNLSVSVTDSSGESATNVFNIIVGNARESANSTIADYKTRITKVKSDINAYPSWIQSRIKEEVDIDSLDTSVKNLENDFNNASLDEEFEDIMLELVDLKVPQGISSGIKGDVPIEIGLDALNTDYIEEISGVEISDREGRDNLRNNIIAWMSNNVRGTMNFEEIEAEYPGEDEAILTRFNLQITPIGDLSNAYLIIDFPLSQIEFTRNYGQTEILGASYVPASSLRNVEFAVEGGVRPGELASYISPLVSELGDYEQILACDYDRRCERDRGETNSNCPTDCRPYGTAVFLIIGLILAGIVAWVLMRLWYKRHYENKLFPKRIDLYNITNFVKNAKNKGLSNMKIRSRLKKSGWNGEQISYAFKKVK